MRVLDRNICQAPKRKIKQFMFYFYTHYINQMKFKSAISLMEGMSSHGTDKRECRESG